MKRFISIVLLVSVICTLCSCGSDTENISTTEEPYVLPTTIIDADISLPYTSSDSFDPYTSKSNFNRDLITVLYESLYVQTADGKGRKELAVSETVNGTTVTVDIISGVKFSDGTTLTAHHVKSSYEKASANAYFKDALSNVSSVSVTDDNTIVFNLYYHDDMVLNTLDFPIVYYSGESCFGSGKYSVDYLDEVPFLAVNTSHREYKSSWNKQIALYDMAGISSPIYPFKANEISVYRNDLSGGDYTNLSSATVSEKMNNLVFVGVNSVWAGTVVSNAWFRQVINVGIDRTAIASASFLGQTDAVSAFFREELYTLDGVSRPALSGDTVKAVQILEQNGYTAFNDEGIRTNGTNALKVSILVCNINQYKVDVAEALKASLEALGIGVSIIEKSTVEEYEASLKEGYFDLYIGETQMTSNYDLSEFFAEDGALSYGINESFRNAYVLYNSGENTLDMFVASCNDFVPVVPLFYRKSVVSVNPNITGVDISQSLYDGICDWKLKD